MYIFTETDRLEIPHNYMYTKYYGKPFVDEYIETRTKFIQSIYQQASYEKLNDIDSIMMESLNNFLIGNIHHSKNIVSSNNLESISLDYIDTRKTLLSLINSVFKGEDKDINKYWIDFFVQRFEVTKKISKSYYPNKLKKGCSNNKDVSLYFIFSLLLCIYYHFTQNIKYLNTSLKVNDLLCSLNEPMANNISKHIFIIILENELANIKNLFKQKTGE